MYYIYEYAYQSHVPLDSSISAQRELSSNLHKVQKGN